MDNKIGGTILVLVGLIVASVMMESTMARGMNWFYRTGYQGFIIGVLMLLSGIYSILDLKHNIIIRLVWSIIWILGSIIPAFILLSFATGDSIMVFIVALVVILILYLGLVGTTVREIVQN